MFERIVLPQSIDDVEALAAMRALLFTQNIGISYFILKGDLEIIIKSLKSNEESFAFYGHLNEETKILTSSFANVRFSDICK